MTKKQKKVIIVGARNKKGVVELINVLLPWLKKQANIIAVDITGRMNLSKQKSDLILVFGGDGAILSTARRLKRKSVPVAGVNLGKFGFLSAISQENMKTKLKKILTAKSKISYRTMLQVEVYRSNNKLESWLALNDMVINRGSISRMLYCRVFVNNKEVAVMTGDGIIVSTPTGSTAYSLSAGGPILHPDLDGFILTPICTHSLNIRPLLIPTSHTIEVEIFDNPEEVILTIDGQVFIYLHPNDVIKVRKAKHRFMLVENDDMTFYDLLATKLKWGGSLIHGKS